MEAWLENDVLPTSNTRDATKQCIYKVPEWLKDGEPDSTAYKPEIVSFGPHHWRTPKLLEMDNHKLRCLTQMLTRNVNRNIKEFHDEMWRILPDVRLCYEAGVNGYKGPIPDDEFVKMLVVDGCFMLEYLMVFDKGLIYLGYGLDDPVFSKKTIMEVIGRDMIKVENQLPIIVLKTLLDIQYKPDCVELLYLPCLILKVFSPIWVTNEVIPEDESTIRMAKVAAFISRHMVHCLDIFRSNLLFEHSFADEIHCLDIFPPDILCGLTATGSTRSITLGARSEGKGDSLLRRILCLRRRTPLYEKSRTNSVENLRGAGIKFRIRNKRPFWDIKFDKRGGCLRQLGCLRRAYLEIPPIHISKTSKTMFLNLIAFEQCHFKVFQEMVITDYVAFMDTLINMSADVARLHKAEIIVHQLGNEDEVAELFNSLVKKAYVASEDGRLKGIYKELNDYCGIKRHALCADFRHNVAKNTWVCLSLVAALILFILTGAQTLYTIYPYYYPRS